MQKSRLETFRGNKSGMSTDLMLSLPREQTAFTTNTPSGVKALPHTRSPSGPPKTAHHPHRPHHPRRPAAHTAPLSKSLVPGSRAAPRRAPRAPGAPAVTAATPGEATSATAPPPVRPACNPTTDTPFVTVSCPRILNGAFCTY